MPLKFAQLMQRTHLLSVMMIGTMVWIFNGDLSCFIVCAQEKPSGNDQRSRTILMADEGAIFYHSGLKQVLQKPQRHETNPVIRNDSPWELAIGYCTIHRDKQSGRYQCWYQSYAGGRAKDPTRRVVLCYATSVDGLVWEKPKLRLFDFNGDLDTNIVLVGNGGRSVNYGASVLVDVLDPDSTRRYKLAYWDFVEREGNQVPGLCVAFSEDGIRWEKYPEAPLLQGGYGDPTQPPLAENAGNEPSERPAISDVMDLMWDPVAEQYAIYSKTWIDGPKGRRFWKRAIVRTTSKDFIHWTRPELILNPSRQADGQFHGVSVFYHEGLYLGFLQRLDFGGFDQGGTGNMPAELIWSRDGLQWKRPLRHQFFMPINQKSEAFDAGCLWTNATPIHLETTSRLYYGAYPGWHADLNASTTGIGLMTIPRNRWIGLTPIDGEGQVTLKALYLNNNSRINLNAIAEGGEVRPELLDASGYRVNGFTRDQVEPLKGDQLKHPIHWKDNALHTLEPGLYQMRIHLRNATLYSLSIHTANAP